MNLRDLLPSGLGAQLGQSDVLTVESLEETLRRHDPGGRVAAEAWVVQQMARLTMDEIGLIQRMISHLIKVRLEAPDPLPPDPFRDEMFRSAAEIRQQFNDSIQKQIEESKSGGGQ